MGPDWEPVSGTHPEGWGSCRPRLRPPGLLPHFRGPRRVARSMCSSSGHLGGFSPPSQPVEVAAGTRLMPLSRAVGLTVSPDAGEHGGQE